MGIGKRIKEARGHLGLTQSELAALVGVTSSAVTNYEKDTSHPKEPVLYKLLEVLKVDANYLFQDVSGITQKEDMITLFEFDLIQKYRSLDAYGKNVIGLLLEAEYQRCMDILPPAPSLPKEDLTAIENAMEQIGRAHV